MYKYDYYVKAYNTYIHLMKSMDEWVKNDMPHRISPRVEGLTERSSKSRNKKDDDDDDEQVQKILLGRGIKGYHYDMHYLWTNWSQ